MTNGVAKNQISPHERWPSDAYLRNRSYPRRLSNKQASKLHPKHLKWRQKKLIDWWTARLRLKNSRNGNGGCLMGRPNSAAFARITQVQKDEGSVLKLTRRALLVGTAVTVLNPASAEELGTRPVMRVSKEAVLFGPSERSYGRFLGSRAL